MARPVKQGDNKRELVIRVRATAAEKSRIWLNAKDAGLTPSDYLRGLAVNARPVRAVPTPDREILLKMLAELNMNGSNLNQIARALNRRQDSAELIGTSEQALTNALYGVATLTRYLMEILG